jgi:hypothetical protein
MENSKLYSDWATRRVPQNNQRLPIQTSQVAANVAPLTLPPGYGYLVHPTLGIVLVPLSGLQVPSVVLDPASVSACQPTNIPVVQPRPFSRPSDTCTLVRPGDRDTYAELLQRLPDLVPPTNYDAMNGNFSPETLADVSGTAEFQESVAYRDPPRAFSPQSMPGGVVRDLGRSK